MRSSEPTNTVVIKGRAHIRGTPTEMNMGAPLTVIETRNDTESPSWIDSPIQSSVEQANQFYTDYTPAWKRTHMERWQQMRDIQDTGEYDNDQDFVLYKNREYIGAPSAGEHYPDTGISAALDISKINARLNQQHKMAMKYFRTTDNLIAHVETTQTDIQHIKNDLV
jgi:DNA repair ATPase RecN